MTWKLPFGSGLFATGIQSVCEVLCMFRAPVVYCWHVQVWFNCFNP